MKWLLSVTLVVVVSILGAVSGSVASGGLRGECDLTKPDLRYPGEELTCILEIVRELQASVNALNLSEEIVSWPVPSGIVSGGSLKKCDLTELDMEPPYRQIDCILEMLGELKASVEALKAPQENASSTLPNGVESGGIPGKCDLAELDLKSPGEQLSCILEIVKELQASLDALNLAQGITFLVGPDETLTYPSNLKTLSDEHTTFIPPAPGSNTYLVFAATFGSLTGAPVVLETTDLQTFTLAAGYTQPVMSPPLSFNTCKSSYDPEFDLNYAAPGSVIQDPTLPPGNLIMIYEAENHCPGGVWQQPFYVTVGFTRSSDNGKTWPPPVDSEFGGPDRYPVLKISTPEPTTPEQPPIPLGDALPSAFVDGNNLYVTYTYVGPGSDGFARVARATLGGSGQVSFSKWHNGTFSEPGIGGQDSGVLPSKGCVGYQNMAQISYNDALRLYLMTFVCVSVQPDQQGVLQPYQGAWYFSTATSLDSQNWTAPQIIENSQFPVTQGCGGGGSGRAFDGWYPSFMSPRSAAGNTSSSGRVFFLNGCDTGARTFMARTFTITGPPPVVDILVAPPSLNFASVNVGQSADQTITITNQASSTGVLRGEVGTVSAPFSVVSGEGPFNLAPGQSATVTVRFSPTTPGVASANISITHNATNQGSPTNVPLSGTGVAPGAGVVVSFITGPNEATPGGRIQIQNTLTNLGSQTAATSTVNFYLSTDTQIDTGDVFIGKRTIRNLAPGASSGPVSTMVTVPRNTAPGSYFIGAIVGNNTNFDPNGITICLSLSKPRLLSPKNRGTNISTTPTLTWASVNGASTYEVQVATDSAFTNIVASKTGLTTPEWAVTPALSSGTSFSWRVRAVNPCGPGPYGATSSFRTAP